jgi:hypothetical protein
MMWLSTKALIVLIVCAFLLVFKAPIALLFPFFLAPATTVVLVVIMVLCALVIWFEFKNS